MDVVQMDRMEKAWKRHADKLSQRILSDYEIEYSKGFPPNRMVEFLSGRFAAKEAIAKAVGCGLANLHMPCVTVALGNAGLRILWEPPTNGLSSDAAAGNTGAVSTVAGSAGASATPARAGAVSTPPWPADAVWHVSISHAAGLAVAMAILERV